MPSAGGPVTVATTACLVLFGGWNFFSDFSQLGPVQQPVTADFVLRKAPPLETQNTTQLSFAEKTGKADFELVEERPVDTQRTSQPSVAEEILKADFELVEAPPVETQNTTQLSVAKEVVKAKARCDTFSCSGSHPVNKGGEIECSGDAASCESSTCCEARARCDSFFCNGSKPVNTGNHVECSGNAASCDVSTCCKEQLFSNEMWLASALMADLVLAAFAVRCCRRWSNHLWLRRPKADTTADAARAGSGEAAAATVSLEASENASTAAQVAPRVPRLPQARMPQGHLSDAADSCESDGQACWAPRKNSSDHSDKEDVAPRVPRLPQARMPQGHMPETADGCESDVQACWAPRKNSPELSEPENIPRTNLSSDHSDNEDVAPRVPRLPQARMPQGHLTEAADSCESDGQAMWAPRENSPTAHAPEPVTIPSDDLPSDESDTEDDSSESGCSSQPVEASVDIEKTDVDTLSDQAVQPELHVDSEREFSTETAANACQNQDQSRDMPCERRRSKGPRTEAAPKFSQRLDCAFPQVSKDHRSSAAPAPKRLDAGRMSTFQKQTDSPSSSSSPTLRVPTLPLAKMTESDSDHARLSPPSTRNSVTRLVAKLESGST